jgi:hypothetical protein
MDFALLICLAGMAIVLTAFILNVLHKLKASDHSYLILNIVGSLLLIWYAALLQSLPFLILNVIWVLSALWGLLHGKKL